MGERTVHCQVDDEPEQHEFDHLVLELAHFSQVVCARLSNGDVRCAKLWQPHYIDEDFRWHDLPTPTPRRWPRVATGVTRIVTLAETVGMIVGESQRLMQAAFAESGAYARLRVEPLALDWVTELHSTGLLHCAVVASEVHCWGMGVRGAPHYLSVGPLGYDPATLPSVLVLDQPHHVLDLEPGEELQLLGEILCVRRRGRDLRCDRGIRDTMLRDYWEVGELPEGTRVWSEPPPVGDPIPCPCTPHMER